MLKSEKTNWASDLQVFCMQIILLTTRVKLIRKAFVAFNVCFYVFRLFSRVKSIRHKMVHFGTYWSILEKMTKVNDEVKPEDTTIEDMHNLPSPLGEPKPIRRASFEIFWRELQIQSGDKTYKSHQHKLSPSLNTKNLIHGPQFMYLLSLHTICLLGIHPKVYQSIVDH